MSQLENQLEWADLQKLRKELEARKEALDERERLFDFEGKKAEIVIMEAKIGYLEGSHKQLEDGFEVKRSEHKTKLAEAHNTLQKKLREIERAEGKLSVAKDDLGIFQADTQMLEGERASIIADIAERKEYLANQEESIDTVVLDANDRLHEIEFEAKRVEDTKAKNLGDIVRLEQEKAALKQFAVLESDKLAELTKNYENRARDYREELKRLNTESEQRQNRLDELGSQIKSRSQAIDTRESSIKIKEIAQAERAKELDFKERRLKSNFAVAGEAYE